MVIANQNMGPPVPPLHHPPAHPHEDPRIIQHRVPGQIDPAYLADQMAQLHVDPQRSAQSYQTGHSEPIREHTRSPYYYIGYTFFKAEAAPGQKSTWNQVEKTRMNLSQADLFQLVQKRAKKSTAVEQYQALSKLKRTHVDQLINEHSRSDPRFEWTCAYIKEDYKPVKGKGARRGDFETLSMDVVIVRGPVTAEPADVHTHSKPREEHTVNPDNFMAEDVRIPRVVEINGQWNQPAINHAQMPANMNQAQQHPQHAYQQPHFPAQGHADTARQQQHQQTQWSGMHQQPEVHHHGVPHPGNNPQFQPQNPGIRVIPVAPDAHPQSLDRDLGPQHNHHAAQPFMRPEIHNQTSANKIYTPRSSSLHVGPEVEWPPESSSLGDDDSELFDFEDESSATEGSEDIIDEAPKKTKSWRGSLHHRQNSASRQNRPEVAYRTHYRKKPTKPASDSKLNRSKYPVGYVEVIPANSKQSSKRTVKPQLKEGAAQQQPRSRPKIVQAPANSADLDLVHLGEKLLKGRERNDIRTRILDDREARVERREKLVEHQARMLDEKLEEARYLDRHLPLRETGLFQRRYYL